MHLKLMKMVILYITTRICSSEIGNFEEDIRWEYSYLKMKSEAQQIPRLHGAEIKFNWN